MEITQLSKFILYEHSHLAEHSVIYMILQNTFQIWTFMFCFSALQVHVLPARTFLSLLQRGVVSMNEINLLLLDDCHLAMNENHPYVEIMTHHCENLPSPPRVVAVTASVLNEQCKTPQALEQSLSQLETTLHSTAETSTDNLVADVYSAKPEEVIIDCEEYVDDTGLFEQFQKILKDGIEFLDDINMPYDEDSGETNPAAIPRTALTECLYVLDSLGPWCCGKIAGVLAKQVIKIIHHESEEWPKRLLQYSLTQLSLIDHVMTEIFERKVQSIGDFYRYMSPRVRELIEILHGYKPDDNFMIIGSEGGGLDISSASAMEDVDEDDDDDDDNDSINFSDDEEFQEEVSGGKKAKITEIKDNKHENKVGFRSENLTLSSSMRVWLAIQKNKQIKKQKKPPINR